MRIRPGPSHVTETEPNGVGYVPETYSRPAGSGLTRIFLPPGSRKRIPSTRSLKNDIGPQDQP